MIKTCKKCNGQDLYSNGRCKPCTREVVRQASARWYAAHPDKARERVKEFQSSHSEFVKKANSEWKLRNRRHCTDLELARAKANPDVMNAHNAKRRASKKNAIPSWSDPNKIRAMYICAQLMTKLTGIKHAVDHIVPLTSDMVCGLHTHDNLTSIPALENSKKSNKVWPGMW